MLRTNTISDDDYKMSLSERRLHNHYLDLSIQCVELMGYELIGEDGMPAKGVVTHYYSIEKIHSGGVILHLYELTVLFGIGRIYGAAWDTQFVSTIKEIIQDAMWDYGRIRPPYNPNEEDAAVIMESFIRCARESEYAEKKEIT